MGIVCASAPCLRALVGRYIPSLLRLGREDTVDLYTMPVSQVVRRLPGAAAGAGQDAESAGTTCVGTSRHSKGPDSDTSSTGEEHPGLGTTCSKSIHHHVSTPKDDNPSH